MSLKTAITSDGEQVTLKTFLYYLGGVIFCSLGISLCTKAGFGLSMIGAGPYILHVFFKNMMPWFTQGTAEYFWEALILAVTCIIIRKAKVKYLLSFITAVICGLEIDACLFVLGGNGVYSSLTARITSFACGTIICAFGVACYFRTNLPLQVYELTVTEIAKNFNIPNSKVKLGFDISMLAICILMTLILNHSFAGIGIGTFIITAVNAPLISIFGKLLDKVDKK